MSEEILEIWRLPYEARDEAYQQLMRSAEKALPLIPSQNRQNRLGRGPKPPSTRGAAVLERVKAKGQYVMPWRKPLQQRRPK
jgi:hypothetical protein